MSDHPTVSEGGSLLLPAMRLPPSPSWSARAQRVFMNRFSRAPVSASVNRPKADDTEETYLAGARAFRAGMEAMHRRMCEINGALYPIAVEDAKLVECK
jgi:hypothetical protein